MLPRLSPLITSHEQLGAKFTTFGGWKMPIRFGSIIEEHNCVRNAVGKFDVSHMGQIYLDGKDAEYLTNKLVSNNVTRLRDNQAQYAMITDDSGVILDDTLVYRNSSESFMFIPNAGHDEEMFLRWVHFRDEWDLDVTIKNSTNEIAMFAIQGPLAVDSIDALSPDPLSDLKRFTTTVTTISGITCTVSRTGYTGEDGFELLLSSSDAVTLWDALDFPSCGLGSRDTLRTEMGFLLSGQDFNHQKNPRNPFEAGVDFTVDLKQDFIGRDALLELHSQELNLNFIGFSLSERSIPRPGSAILNNMGEQIGVVTSGTLSPTLDLPIGLGYVPPSYSSIGSSLQVAIRNSFKPATICSTPFINPQ
ncbi:MAG: glycine cleavage system aminomethyltransferase GcvT [Halobacteriales archaeon]